MTIACQKKKKKERRRTTTTAGSIEVKVQCRVSKGPHWCIQQGWRVPPCPPTSSPYLLSLAHREELSFVMTCASCLVVIARLPRVWLHNNVANVGWCRWSGCFSHCLCMEVVCLCFLFFCTISGLKLEIVMHMTSYLVGPFTNVLMMLKCLCVTSQSVDFSKLVNRFFCFFYFSNKISILGRLMWGAQTDNRCVYAPYLQFLHIWQHLLRESVQYGLSRADVTATEHSNNYY